MWMPPTINDYYQKATEGMKGEVEMTEDARVLGMDPDQWANYLVTKWGMVPIELDESVSPEMIEVEQTRQLPGYDIRSDRGPGEHIRATLLRVEVAVCRPTRSRRSGSTSSRPTRST